MLLRFSVGNYRSFTKIQSISFEASKVSRLEKQVTEVGSHRVLKGGLLFGANASGKSNLIKAIDFSRSVICKGLKSVDYRNCYFRLDDTSINQPGFFEYVMLIDDDAYTYGIKISYDKGEIVEEYLINTTKKKQLYHRFISDGESVVITDITYKKSKEYDRFMLYLEDFKGNVADSLKTKSIISDVYERSNINIAEIESIKEVFDWICKVCVIYPDSVFDSYLDLYPSKHHEIDKLINCFDTGIVSMKPQKKKLPIETLLSNLSNEDAIQFKKFLNEIDYNHSRNLIINGQLLKVLRDENGDLVYNIILLDHGKESVLFEFSDESDGTKRLFDLIPLLIKDSRPPVVFVDEIERSLHVNAINKFLELFFDVIDTGSNQMFFTTHNTNLLDLNKFRQDQIWFVEREENNSSRIYSLLDFKERFDKKIDKAYISGKYGAVPRFIK